MADLKKKLNGFKLEIICKFLKNKGLPDEVSAIICDGLKAQGEDGPDYSTRLAYLRFLWAEVFGFKKLVVENKTRREAEEFLDKIQKDALGYREDLKDGSTAVQ